MLYPDNIDQKLGFTEIRRLLKEQCLSEMGAGLVDKIQFITRADLLEKLLGQTVEFKEILTGDDPFPVSNYLDIRPYLDKIKPENAFLTEEEAHRTGLFLKTVFQVIRYFRDRQGSYPNLQSLFEDLQADETVLHLIYDLLDDKGQVRADASPLLEELLHKIRQAEQESRRRLDHIFRQAVKDGWIADGNLTVREGRLVIPLLAEYKRKIKGFIHDQSATGQTVFIEPAEVFDLNNKIRDLQFEKQRELVRILTALSARIRPYIPLLSEYLRLLTRIDFIRAKARLAMLMEWEMPRLVKAPVCRLVRARHPLLEISHKETGQEVVPLDVTIGDEHRVVVVSGPNAGGKSVCLKTVGLLQLMFQSGLLIPASEFSEMGVFGKILADIGDDQSIESDLSTYSAHLSKMKEFVFQAGEDTLILIDEFGTGTDPQFGGPMAEAVLETINAKKAKGVVTTHYSNLKLFAGNTPGLVNASMLFDNRGLRPLYRLETGKPGSSYAFEIARKIGLPENVLKAAREKAGAEQHHLDRLLIELEREKKQALDTRLELQARQQKLEALLKENDELKSYYEQHRKSLLKEAREEARQVILSANRLVENTIREIRETGAEKESTKKARARLQEARGKLSAVEKPSSRSAAGPIPVGETEKIAPGTWVKLKDSELEGEVLSLSKDQAVVATGDIRTVVKLNRLQKVKRKKVKNGSGSSAGLWQNREIARFSPEIDVRGMRGDEALAEIEQVIDRALMLNVNKLKLIHGKGDGILRKLIRDYLKKYDQVTALEDEHPDRGGDGVTYVYLE